MSLTDMRDPLSAGRAVNWYPFNDCFPGKARIGDADGICERHGHLLIIEAKQEGAPVPRGQMLMYDAIRRQGNSVVIIWHEKCKAEDKWIDLRNISDVRWSLFGDKWTGSHGLSYADGLLVAKEVLREWWKIADTTYWDSLNKKGRR